MSEHCHHISFWFIGKPVEPTPEEKLEGWNYKRKAKCSDCGEEHWRHYRL